MRSPSPLVRRALAAASLVFAACLQLAACTHTPETPANAGKPGSTSSPRDPAAPAGSGSAAASPSSSASASATSSATPSAPQEPVRPAWTDAEVVAELAKDCHYLPPTSDPMAVAVLLCTLDAEQSCVPDSCNQTNEEVCRAGCKKTCETCSQGCAKSCDTCKKACNDDACKAACATGCGKCHQECVTTMDHCDSGKCSPALSACYDKTNEEWEKSPCKNRCDAMSACVKSCNDKAQAEAAKRNDIDTGAIWDCNTKCWKSKMAGCPDKFQARCGTF